MKKDIFAVMLAVMLLTLAGCSHAGPGNFNSDGSFTTIEYKNPLPFSKAPVYRMEDSVLYMTSGGQVGFTARVMTGKDIAVYQELEPVAASSNLTVYRNGAEAEYAYTYILDLKGTEVSFVAFETDAEPEGDGSGKNFDINLTYRVGTLETVPDIAGLKKTD